MTNITIALTRAMCESLHRYINAQRTWASDPMKAREEARSYAAEFVNAAIGVIGGPVTHEQHIAHATNSGPAPHEIEKANVLELLEQ